MVLTQNASRVHLSTSNIAQTDYLDSLSLSTQRLLPALLTRRDLPSNHQQPQHLDRRNSSSSRGSILLPRWQPDEEVTKCPVCGASFGLFFRKHHCRKCGKVVCHSCSQHRITIPRQFVVHPPPVTTSSPFAALASRDPAPTPLSSSASLQASEANAPGEHESILNPSASVSQDPADSEYTDLSAAEVVRVCNPCVPDPNLSPPPQQQPLPLSIPPPPFSNAINSRDALSRATNQRPHYEPLSRPFRDYSIDVYPSTTSPYPQLHQSRALPAPSERSHGHAHESRISSRGLARGTTTTSQASGARARPSHHTAIESFRTGPYHYGNFNPSADYRQPSSQFSNEPMSSRHRYHNLTSSSSSTLQNSARRGQEGLREITGCSSSGGNLQSSPASPIVHQQSSLQNQPNTSSSTSSSSSPPRYRPMRFATQRVSSSQQELREEDECPVCGQELPPKGPNENEDSRIRHVRECISLYSSPMPSSAPFTASASPPESHLPIQNISLSDQVMSGNAAPLTHEAISSSHGRSNSPEEGVQPTVRSRRATGNRMLVYRATEKDCLAADGELQECVICFEEFAEGDEMGRLECLCNFHRACIRQWWDTKGAGSCPTHQLHL